MATQEYQQMNGERRLIEWRYLSLAPLFCLVLLIFDYPTVLGNVFISVQHAALFVMGAGAGIVLLGLVAIILTVTGLPILHKRWSFLGAAAILIGLITQVLLVNYGIPSTSLCIVCGLVTGIGLGLLLLLVGTLFSRLDTMHRIFTYTAVDIGIAALGEWLLLLAPWDDNGIVLLIVAAICLVLSLAGIMTKGRSYQEQSKLTEDDKPESQKTEPLRMRPFIDDIWKVAVGLALSLMITGTTWGGYLNGDAVLRGTILFERPFFIFIFAAIAVVVIFILRERMHLNLLFQILPLIAAALLTASWMLAPGDDEFTVMLLSSAVRGAVSAVFLIGTWMYLAASASEKNVPPNMAFGLSFILLAGMMLLGAVFENALPEAIAAVLNPILVVIYLTVAAVATIIKNYELHPAVYQRDLTHTCATIATTYELSTREEEVLLYLARGRSSTYIADKLCISPLTVKSHIKNIYHKLKINTRQQLIDLVEAGTEPLTHG